MRNKGEAIRDLSFEWPGLVIGTVRHIGYLDKESEMIIDVENMPKPLPEEFPVLITYTDKLGNRNRKLIHYVFEMHQWVEDRTEYGIHG